MTVGAIIQARMGSSRLPGKVLMDIAGLPMLAHVVTRSRQAVRLHEVVVATSHASSDDAVAAWCAAEAVPCERGSENDVLDRYRQAADVHGFDIIVRLTADCPLLDPRVVDKVVGAFMDGVYDYASNTQPPTFPDGLDTEVFTRAALDRAWREAALPSEREHVTPYIWKHPELFRLHSVRHDSDLSALRWTVDEAADLEVARAVIGRLEPNQTSMGDVLALLERAPDLAGHNAGVMRNEGYLRSLRQDPDSGKASQ